MPTAGALLESLNTVIQTLRSEKGCAWDRAQTPLTMTPYLLEEAHEVIEAIETSNERQELEELGDLLFHVVFLATVAAEARQFTLEDVIAGITAKMIERHPHVFPKNGLEIVPGPEDWEQAKRNRRLEKDSQASVLDGLPRSLPALLFAQRLTEKASRVGFDWPSAAGAREKLTEELLELDEAVARGNPEDIRQELGDVLFTVVNLSRLLNVDSEHALKESSRKFLRRFKEMERLLHSQGRRPESESLSELDSLWEQVKLFLKKRPEPTTSPSGAAREPS